MAKSPFRFTLEPERLRREAERERVEREAREARERLEREEAELARRREALREARARLAREVDRQFEARPGGEAADEWLARAQFVDELRAVVARREVAVREQRECVRAAQVDLAAKRAELDRVADRLRVLERARDEQQRKWRADAERRAEKQRDEDAGLRHGRRPRDDRS